ncbi:MAG: FAD:protein FMN transferase [bacterium]
MFRINVFATCLYVLLCVRSVPASGDNAPIFEVSTSKFLLGTKVDITALHTDIIKCKKACYFAFEEINRIEQLLSAHIETSEISRINRSAGMEPVKVGSETFAMIERALGYAKRFDGFFDISIGPVTELWGFNGEAPAAIPDDERLRAMLKLVDFSKVRLNAGDRTVFLPLKKMKLDLGGIAKGYAVDKAAEVLRKHGISTFLINAGGDIYTSGRKDGNKRWVVGLQHPRKPNNLLATFELSDFAVATSGDYERYFEEGGKRYHHIIDPKTGYPAELTRSVTVFAPTVEEADVWATYLFIAGIEKFKKDKRISSMKTIFVDTHGGIQFDESLKAHYRLSFDTR